MPVSMNDVRRVLDPEEPDYAAAAQLGEEALPHLAVLVAGPDPMLASKAAYAASLLQGDIGADVVRAASASTDPVVRVAAAAGARNLSASVAREAITRLLNDDDAGIRKVVRAALERPGR